MRGPEHAVVDAVVALGRAARESGLPVCVDDEITLCRALGEIDLRRRWQVYWAARSTYVRHPDDVPRFDPLFERFWSGVDLLAEPRVAEHSESDPRMPGPQRGGESLPQFRLEGRSSHLVDGQAQRASREIPTAAGREQGAGRSQGALAAYSPEEAVIDARSLEYGADELAAVRRLADELRTAAPERRSRRLRPSRRTGRLDVQRTLRRALRTDGDSFQLAWAAPSRRPRRVVVLCDVSGSMERYSRLLLASLRAVVAAGIKAEAFAFATRLTRLTGELSGHDVSGALEQARGAVEDWSGGTRIGQALAQFNRIWGRRGLARGAIVIVASDGWDRGDPELLARELHRLRLHCRRLVWLNPRPGGLDGQPLAIGMRAALPYVDDYVAGHDPRAIAGLAPLICGLGAGRPARKQEHRLPGRASTR